jgi:hypothetical protein
VICLLASSLDIGIYSACVYYFHMDGIMHTYFVFPPPTHMYLLSHFGWHLGEKQRLKFMLNDQFC